MLAIAGLAVAATAAYADQGATPAEGLTPKQVQELVANAKTSADHLTLQTHFLALAAKYEADADNHVAEAKAYRKNPSFRDTKSPGGPGTATHCERFADLTRQAAKEARELAAMHERMASGK
jgi:hypothetical protein